MRSPLLYVVVVVLLSFFFTLEDSVSATYYDPIQDRVLPWDPVPTSVLRASDKKVFAHYFPPFPIMINNLPTADDYYTKGYLNPFGENYKHWTYGGFLRCRPPPRAVVNASNWADQDMEVEVQRGIQMGLDGFLVDLLTTDETQGLGKRFPMLLDAALRVDPGFSIGFMPDMTAEFKTYPERMAPYLASHANRSNIFRFNDKVMVIPFLPSLKQAWWWEDQLKLLGQPASFMPLFLSVSGFVPQYSNVSVGVSSWGGHYIGYADQGVISEAAYSYQYVPLWMAPGSPGDFRPRATWYYETKNSYVFRKTWESIILNTTTQWVQLVTWNDYSENTQVSPNSCSGTSIPDLANYYIIWFKTGSPPEIKRDAIYYFHRVHSSAAKPDGIHQNITFTCHIGSPVDEVEMLAFLIAPATLSIKLSNGSIATKEVEEGMQSFVVPLTQGPPPEFEIIRGGVTVLSITSEWSVSDNIEVQDFSFKSRSIVANSTSSTASSASSLFRYSSLITN